MCFSDKYKQFLWYYCILFMWWKNNLGTLFPFFFITLLSSTSIVWQLDQTQFNVIYTILLLYYPIILLSHNISSRELQSYAPFLCVAKASSKSISFFSDLICMLLYHCFGVIYTQFSLSKYASIICASKKYVYEGLSLSSVLDNQQWHFQFCMCYETMKMLHTLLIQISNCFIVIVFKF